LLISKILGRKKEDIVIALNYQKYYQNHIDALKVDIKELSDKVEKLLLLVIEKNETINFLKSNK
jgi:arabinogalactan endo-1,4-beta-galactosidase